MPVIHAPPLPSLRKSGIKTHAAFAQWLGVSRSDFGGRPRKPGGGRVHRDGRNGSFFSEECALPPFHGEFAIDPKTGAILRLTMQAALDPRLPLDESSVVVEYGPVVIGGTTYIYSLRSVSIQGCGGSWKFRCSASTIRSHVLPQLEMLTGIVVVMFNQQQ
jgi:hypothetical protein